MLLLFTERFPSLIFPGSSEERVTLLRRQKRGRKIHLLNFPMIMTLLQPSLRWRLFSLSLPSPFMECQFHQSRYKSILSKLLSVLWMVSESLQIFSVSWNISKNNSNAITCLKGNDYCNPKMLHSQIMVNYPFTVAFKLFTKQWYI